MKHLIAVSTKPAAGQFDNYPIITSRLRDLNYGFTDLTINNCPYVFRPQKGGTPLDDSDE